MFNFICFEVDEIELRHLFSHYEHTRIFFPICTLDVSSRKRLKRSITNEISKLNLEMKIY